MTENLEQLLDETLAGDALILLTLSEPTNKKSDCRKVTVRPVLLREQRRFQFEYQHPQKVSHKNVGAREAKALIRSLLGQTFRQGLFCTQAADFQVFVGSPDRVTIRRKIASKAAPALSHNRSKNYLLAEGVPVDFLVRLGVMGTDGRVLAAKQDKFRQINRFLEMVDDVADSLPQDGPLRIVDFGSGKAYLTFALYHYWHALKGREVTIVGLDLKTDVVEFCGKVAQELGYMGLTFRVGDIGTYAGEGEGEDAADMVVTLHACDTATDDALVKAVGWGAKVILSVPCCQHELFRQIDSEALKPMLKYGIVRERLAALVTDTVRAGLLETAGYSVQILEFIALEHTAKNLMIRAVKRPGRGGRAQATEEYQAFRDFWHIQPHMETAMNRLKPSGD